MSSLEIVRGELDLDMELKDREIESLKTSLNFAHGQIADLRRLYTEVNDDLADLRKELSLVRNWGAQDHDRLVYVEDQGRRNSLRFRGIPEDRRETWEQSQMKILRLINQKLGKNPEIERAHRIGKRQDHRQRPSGNNSNVSQISGQRLHPEE